MNDDRPITRFAILMMGRSGSSLLTELLDSHPQIVAKGEKIAGMKKAEKQLGWVRRLYREGVSPEIRAVGFKTKARDIVDKDSFAELLREQSARILILRRRNVVKMTISWLNAQRLYDKTGDWNLKSNQDRLPPMVVDLEGFDRRLGQMEQATRTLEEYGQSLGLSSLSLHYEDLLQNLTGTLERIYHFLDVDSASAHSGMKKNTSDNLRDAIENYDELRARYLGTRYVEMFEEVVDPSLKK